MSDVGQMIKNVTETVLKVLIKKLKRHIIQKKNKKYVFKKICGSCKAIELYINVFFIQIQLFFVKKFT